MTNTPKKLEAGENFKPAPIDNTDIVNVFREEGGQIFHVVPKGGARGITLAFKARNGRIEYATAVQHRSDQFTKKIGTKTAIKHFRAGKTTCLPLKKENFMTFFKWMYIYSGAADA